MLAPWKKSYDQPRLHIKKQRHYFANKGLYSQTMLFPVVMYMDVRVGTTEKAKHRRIDDFELWCWRRRLRVPWTARRSNQSILKEINPEYSQKGWCWSFNTLATWCKEPIIRKDLDAGKDWRQEEKRRQRMRWLDGITWLSEHEFE